MGGTGTTSCALSLYHPIGYDALAARAASHTRGLISGDCCGAATPLLLPVKFGSVDDRFRVRGEPGPRTGQRGPTQPHLRAIRGPGCVTIRRDAARVLSPRREWQGLQPKT